MVLGSVVGRVCERPDFSGYCLEGISKTRVLGPLLGRVCERPCFFGHCWEGYMREQGSRSNSEKGL